MLVANLEAAAQAENARRAAARAWAEAKAQEEANRHALEKAGHAVSEFFGGGNDTPPPVNVGGNPSVSAPAPLPAARKPMEGTGGSGGVSSAHPDKLRTFASSTQGASDQLAGVPYSLDQSLRSFVSSCSWAHLDASGCVAAVQKWLNENAHEVAWATTVAGAFAAAGGSGGVARVSNAAIEASLRASHIPPSRATVSVEPPVGYGSPATTGYADDPVNTATGNFLETETDLSFGGASSLVSLERTYNSLNRSAGAFGPGWSSWTEAGLAFDDDFARFTLPDGRVVRFPRLADGWDRSETDHLRLARTDEGFRVTTSSTQAWLFSPSGRLLELAQGPASRIVLMHDARGRLVRMQHTFGRWLELRYAEVTGVERVVAVVASDHRRVEYRYDGLGRLVAAVSAGAERTYEWNDESLLFRVVDPDGVVEVDNTYDEVGRVVSQRSPHGRTTFYGYLPGNVTVVSDEDGTRSNTWVHDVQGRLVGIIDGEDQRQSMAYDGDDNVVMVTERNGAVTVAQYDDEGRQLVRVLSSGARLEWVYDELGRAVEAAVVSDDQRAVTTLAYEGDAPDPVRVTDATGGTTSMVWEQGLLKQVTDPTGVSVRLEHDEFGELVATTDALGNTARLERDAQGRVVAAITPLGNRTAYRYDDVTGALVSQTDPTGATWRYEHTTAGRTTAVIDPLGHRTEMAYDEAGEQSATTDPLGRTITEQYDDLGNLASVELPDGSRWGFGHDSLSRLTGFTDGTGGRWQMEYDANGNLRRTVDATGVEQTAEHNVLGLPTSAGDADSRARAAYDQLVALSTSIGPMVTGWVPVIVATRVCSAG